MDEILDDVNFLDFVYSVEAWLSKLCKSRCRTLKSSALDWEDLRNEAVLKLWGEYKKVPSILSQSNLCRKILWNSISDYCKAEKRMQKKARSYMLKSRRAYEDE
jgi:DNA-directed RNA polymerase specialized sigma24 family protein